MLKIKLGKCCVHTILLWHSVTSLTVNESDTVRTTNTNNTRDKRLYNHLPQEWAWSNAQKYQLGFSVGYHHNYQNTLNSQQNYFNERQHLIYNQPGVQQSSNYDPYVDLNNPIYSAQIPQQIYFNRQPTRQILQTVQPTYIPHLHEHPDNNKILPNHNPTHIYINLHVHNKEPLSEIRNGQINQNRVTYPQPFLQNFSPNLSQGCPQSLSQKFPQNVPQNIPQHHPQKFLQNFPPLDIPQNLPQNFNPNLSQNRPQYLPQSAPQYFSQNHPQSLPQNFPQNIPQNFPQNIPQNIPQYRPQNFNQNFRPLNTYQNLPQNSNPNLSQNHPQSLPLNFPQNIPLNFPQNIPQNIPQYRPQNFNQNFRTLDTSQNLPQNSNPNLSQNCPQSLPQRTPQNFQQNGPQNFSIDIRQNFTQNLAPNLCQSYPQSLPQRSPQYLPPNFPNTSNPNLETTIQSPISGDFSPNVIDGSIDAKVFGADVDLGNQIIGPTGSLIMQNQVASFAIADIKCDKPYTPPKMPNFETPGRRISEARCYEYIYQLKVKDDLERRNQTCNSNSTRNADGNRSAKRQSIFPVFGGQKAAPEEFAHMAAIGWRGVREPIVFKCGGSLISPNFLLTAAHCRSSRPDTELTDLIPRIARIGGNNIGYKKSGQAFEDLRRRRQSTDSAQLDVGIINIITHEQYDPNMQYFDIALMQLAYSLDFNRQIKPACLWVDLQTSNRIQKAVATGWGVVNPSSGRTSLSLQAGELDIINVNMCNDLLRGKFGRKFNGFADHQLCAGKLSGGIDVCQGDSGGPLQVKVKLPVRTIGNIHALVGIISAGPDCGKPDMPGIYTRVASFIDWIEPKVWN